MSPLRAASCAALSGGASVLFQLLWARELALLLGAKTRALGLVLAVFLAGLGLGAFLFSRWQHRSISFLSTQLLAAILGVANLLLLKRFALHLDAALPLVSALLLGMPATLWGGAWPLLARQRRSAEGTTEGAISSQLIGASALGSAAFVYLGQGLVLPHFGVLSSLFFSAVLCALAALLGWSPAQPQQREESSYAPRATLLGSIAGIAGACTLLFELGFGRVLSLMLKGTYRGHTATLTATLLGLAAGGLAAQRLLKRGHPFYWYFGLQLCGALWTCLAWRGLQLLQLPQTPLRLTPSLGLALLTLGPLMLVQGATLPILVQLLCPAENARPAQRGERLGYLAGWNAMGNAAGALAAGFLTIEHLGVGATLQLAVALQLAASLVLLRSFAGSVARRALAMATLAIIGLLVSFRPADLVSLAIPNLSQHELLYFAEGPTGAVAVTRSERGVTLTIDGLPQGSISKRQASLDSILVALLPLAHIEAAQDALLVGLGTGASARLVRAHGVPRLTIAELEPKVIEAAGLHYPAVPQATLVRADARQLLQRQPQRYDLIVSMPSHPWIATALFTREFFELAELRLTSRGVFSAWFGLNNTDLDTVSTVIKTFDSAFEHRLVYMVPEVNSIFLLGSKQPLRLRAERLNALFRLPLARGHPLLRDRHFLPARLLSGGPLKPKLGALNTDDSLALETGSIAASTTAPDLSALFSAPHIPQDYIREDQVELLVETLELLLGTPGGRLSHQAEPRNLRVAKRYLRALGARLPPRGRRYFKARVQSTNSTNRSTFSALQELSRIPDDWGLRSARMLSTMLHGAALWAHLRSLPQSPDVVLAMIGARPSDGAALLARYPKVSRDASPLLWYLQTVTSSAVEEVEPPDQVRQAFLRTTNLGVLAMCQKHAPKLTEACASRRKLLLKTRIDQLVQQAERALEPTQAAALWYRAARLDRTDRALVKRALPFVLKGGRAIQAKTMMRWLKAQGVSQDELNRLIGEAQR